MKKPSKQPSKTFKKKYIVIAAALCLVLAVIAGILFTSYKIQYYNDAADQANIVAVRELIVQSGRAMKKDAPVEPQTGDVYFPESRIYLPNPNIGLPFTYHYNAAYDNQPAELSVGKFPVDGTTAFYQAKNVNELFNAVPKFQACSRGVKLVHHKLTKSVDEPELKHSLRLSDGRDLYIYVEKRCPDLNDLADTLKNVRAY